LSSSERIFIENFATFNFLCLLELYDLQSAVAVLGLFFFRDTCFFECGLPLWRKTFELTRYNVVVDMSTVFKVGGARDALISIITAAGRFFRSKPAFKEVEASLLFLPLFSALM